MTKPKDPMRSVRVMLLILELAPVVVISMALATLFKACDVITAPPP